MQEIGMRPHPRQWQVLGAALVALTLAIASPRDLPMLRAYLAMLALLGLFVALRIDPELLRERLRSGQVGEDPARLAAIRILCVALFAIVLLDICVFRWSDTVPGAVQMAALGLAGAAIALIGWAMSVNRFFLPVIRVQPERGHHVVGTGPYARVRHPGYAGMALFAPASALALGSWWALLPATALAALFVARAAHEDRFLLAQLDGYRDYAARVPWRLLPGVW